MTFHRAMAVLTVFAAAGLAWAQNRWYAPKIVTLNCSGCHEIDGNAQVPYIPRLAGLDAKYAEKKLTAFRESGSPRVDDVFFWIFASKLSKKDVKNTGKEARNNMVGMSHEDTPEKTHEAVLWYARQAPAPGRRANSELVSLGQSLFMNGLPEQKVLACKTCHGADAQGMGVAPRLAGQNAEYMVGQLEKFSRGDRRHAPEMTMVTRDLDPEQARAAAAYLQSR